MHLSSDDMCNCSLRAVARMSQRESLHPELNPRAPPKTPNPPHLQLTSRLQCRLSPTFGEILAAHPSLPSLTRVSLVFEMYITCLTFFSPFWLQATVICQLGTMCAPQLLSSLPCLPSCGLLSTEVHVTDCVVGCMSTPKHLGPTFYNL